MTVKRTKRTRSQSTNLAAEFFVASQLNRLGYIVTLTLGNTKEVDLIVLRNDGKKVSIDTKGLKNKTNWPVTVKLKRTDHFFVLVAYADQFENLAQFPEVFVIPSLDMRPPVLEKWSGSRKTCVNYRAIRKYAKGKYKDAWKLLFKK